MYISVGEQAMRTKLWALKLPGDRYINDQYSDNDLKVRFFKTRKAAQVYLDDNKFWHGRSVKVVKVIIRIEVCI
jgi:hypothetical protein